MTGATLPPWDSGLLEWVRLVGAVGWMPENKDLRKAKLKGADLSGCDLSGCDMREADVSGTILEGANLKGARLSSRARPCWVPALPCGPFAEMRAAR